MSIQTIAILLGVLWVLCIILGLGMLAAGARADEHDAHIWHLDDAREKRK